ncbi:ATP-binding protein [Vagococcus sp. BWB3-3]|uniref:ATP-binding protein n=1 Tax=Vagococcus allomyrinae TaxID=2794353 RepID=A0A940PDU4_9ENTE|nr:ATP-binding protein [Vagococcus allomyrinae]MBP1040988.1 ATP-binding protein [Vagococcus allomyrinae]
MKEQAKRVIESWLVIEYLSTGKLPYSDEQKPLFEGSKTSLNSFSQIKKGNKSFIYFGIYRSYQMAEIIRRFFKDESEIYNEDTSLNYSLSIQINDEGKYIENSIFIPKIQFLLKEIFSSSFSNASLERLNKAMQRALDTLEVEMQLIFSQGVTSEALDMTQKLIKLHFGLESLLDREIFTLQNRSSKNEPIEVNSLIVSDLETVLMSEELSPALEKYINGEETFKTIDENRDLITQLLDIEKLPAGRWPSNNNFKLSLMQQVAVNSIINEKKDIFSVNGPPGTGKTTLLKDVFANLIIERAQNMASFADPTEAKERTGSFDLKGFKVHTYQLAERIKGFGIVVASSNNGAVENISKDLPKNKEIIHENDHVAEDEIGFSEMIKDVNLFPEYVNYMFDGETKSKPTNSFDNYWGLFSAPLGKQTNISKIFDVLLTNFQLEDGSEELSLYNQLKKERFVQENWDQACQKFIDIQQQISTEKDIIKEHAETVVKQEKLNIQLADYAQALVLIAEKLKRLEELIATNEDKITKIDQKKALLPKIAWYKRLLRQVTGKNDPIIEEYNKQILTLLNENEDTEEQSQKLKSDRETFSQKQASLTKEFSLSEGRLAELTEHFDKDEYQLFNDEMWQTENYDKRQLSVPWLTKRLNYLRGSYFIQALKLHKLFNQANAPIFFSAFTIINRRRELNLNNQEERELLRESWSIFHLMIPVVSTTFASLGNMYRGMGMGSLDYLFIDEAGQATPQAAVGGIWRAKHVIAVGDPSQIEPVVSLEDSLFKTVQDAYALEEKYLSKTTSVQSLADRANQYGMMKPNGERVGVPLWVHRRCLNPMFHVSNDISYDGKMVQGATPEAANKGRIVWLDVKGEVKNKQYVEEQAQALLKQIIDSSHLRNIYVISPFKAVVEQTKAYINKHASDFTKVSSQEVKAWSKTSVGTVHTFQGKEEDTVYFICGTDEKTEGAANWSCQKANLLNVAITRAKKEFIIIGDYSRFKHKSYYQTVAKYSNLERLENGVRK